MNIITGGPSYSTLYSPQVGIFYKVDVSDTHVHSSGGSLRCYYHRITPNFLDVAIVAVGVHWRGYILGTTTLPANAGLFTAEAMRREVSSADFVYSSSY